MLVGIDLTVIGCVGHMLALQPLRVPDSECYIGAVAGQMHEPKRLLEKRRVDAAGSTIGYELCARHTLAPLLLS